MAEFLIELLEPIFETGALSVLWYWCMAPLDFRLPLSEKTNHAKVPHLMTSSRHLADMLLSFPVSLDYRLA